MALQLIQRSSCALRLLEYCKTVENNIYPKGVPL